MANFKIHRSLWNKEPSKIFNYVNTEITWNETETEKYTVLIKLKLIFSRFELSIFCKWTKTWFCEQTRNHSYQFLKVKALPSTPLQDQRKERGLLVLFFLGFLKLHLYNVQGPFSALKIENFIPFGVDFFYELL